MSEPPDTSDLHCRQIAELLTDYIEGRLPPATRELIAWHLDACPPCVAFLNTFRSTLRAVRLLPDVAPVPSEFRRRLLAVLRDRSSHGFHGRTD